MRFGKTTFSGWIYSSPHEWYRNGRDGEELSPFFSNARIELIKTYQFDDGTWYPKFSGTLSFLQKIYDDTTNSKRFRYNQETIAKMYIDDFVIRMDKLKNFT